MKQHNCINVVIHNMYIIIVLSKPKNKIITNDLVVTALCSWIVGS